MHRSSDNTLRRHATALQHDICENGVNVELKEKKSVKVGLKKGMTGIFHDSGLELVTISNTSHGL